MLTGWTGRKWDACRLERSTAPIIAHGPINFMCAPAATAASRSRLLLRSKLFVPAPKSKFNLVVSAGWRAIQRQLKLQRIRLEQDVPPGDLLMLLNHYAREGSRD